MRRDPFDQVCECDFETETHHCICTRRKSPAKGPCMRCVGGKHTLLPKDKEATTSDALAALFGRRNDPMY